MRVIDEVTQAYTEAALWSSTDDNGEPLDQSDAELSDEVPQRFLADCGRFLSDNADLIEQAIDATGNGYTRLGHDLWLTRNHHGAGFWDGEWSVFGSLLTDAAHKMGECDLYVGDDNRIYHS